MYLITKKWETFFLGGGNFFKPINKLVLPIQKLIHNLHYSTDEKCIIDTTPTRIPPPPAYSFFLGQP